MASVCLKLSNLTTLPCFHTFFQLHHDQSSSLHRISFFPKMVLFVISVLFCQPGYSAIFWYLIFLLHRTTLEKTHLKKEDYYDEAIIRKCHFYRSLFCDFSRADNHWEGIYPGLEICCSLQVYLEVAPSDSQLVEKAMKALY